MCSVRWVVWRVGCQWLCRRVVGRREGVFELLYDVVFRRGGSGRCGECCRRSMIVVVVLLLQDVLPALLCVDPHASLD